MDNPSTIHIDQYVKETADEYRFLDPVSGTELAPHEPPPSLWQDPLTSQGLHQVKEMAQRRQLRIQVIHAAHGQAEDFHAGLKASGPALPEAHMVGIETNWRSTFDHADGSQLSAVEYVFSEYPRRRTFQETQLNWLREKKILALPCEYPDNYDSELYRRYLIAVRGTRAAKEAGDLRASNILCGVYQTTRQWIFIAMLGYWLKQLSLQGKLPAEPLSVPLMLGVHRSIEVKLADFGVPLESYEMANIVERLRPHMSSNYFEVFDDMTKHARITKKQLEDPFH